jgi:hypothetical protein
LDRLTNANGHPGGFPGQGRAGRSVACARSAARSRSVLPPRFPPNNSRLRRPRRKRDHSLERERAPSPRR